MGTMRRILIDYKKLDHDLINAFMDAYPHGYGDDDVITFKNHKGEYVEAVEFRTEDTFYLVKVSQSLSNFIANLEDELEKPVDTVSADDSWEDSPVPEMELEADYSETDDLD